MDLREGYEKLTAAINLIDEQLDSLSDTKTAGKRQVTNQLIDKTKDSWESVVESFSKSLESAPSDVLIGVYFGITRGLASKFQEKVAAELEKIVETLPKQEPLINPEDAPAIQKQRSDIYQKLKQLISLAEQFGEAEGMVPPKKRTGATGKRGKRALSYFTWYIEDEKFDKLAEVVAKYDQYEKVSALTDAMKKAGLNLTTPEGDLEFTLPDGKILVGVNGATASDDDEDEDSDEDNSED